MRWRKLCITLLHLLATPDLGDLLLEELVTLLADVDNLLAGNAEVLDSSQYLLGDLGSSLVLGQSIRVIEGVICQFGSALEQDGRHGHGLHVSRTIEHK